MRTLLRPAVALLAVVGLTSACSEELATEMATDWAEGMGADEACVHALGVGIGTALTISNDLATAESHDIERVLAALQPFVDTAPEELRAEAQTLLDGWSALALADTEAERTAAQALVEGPDAEAASDAIAAWLDEHCTPEG